MALSSFNGIRGYTQLFARSVARRGGEGTCMCHAHALRYAAQPRLTLLNRVFHAGIPSVADIPACQRRQVAVPAAVEHRTPGRNGCPSPREYPATAQVICVSLRAAAHRATFHPG